MSPGWKSDPRNERRLRYWDGLAWTERSAPTSRETAAKFVAYEKGGSELPPKVSLQTQTFEPRPTRGPDPVPAPSHPGVLIAFAGFILAVAGAFGPWTEQVVMNRAVFTDPWVTGAFGLVGVFGLVMYLRGQGERWRDSAGALGGILLFNSGLAIWDIHHFADDYPNVALDPTIGWGLWLTAGGAVVAIAGLTYVYYEQRDKSPTYESDAAGEATGTQAPSSGGTENEMSIIEAPERPRVSKVVPRPTHPGVLIAFGGMFLAFVGCFGSWTNPVLVERWDLTFDARAIQTFMVIGAICLVLFLLGRGVGWKIAVYVVCGFAALTIHASVSIVRDARIESSVEWGVWVAGVGVVAVIVGLLWTEISPRDDVENGTLDWPRSG